MNNMTNESKEITQLKRMIVKLSQRIADMEVNNSMATVMLEDMQKENESLKAQIETITKGDLNTQP